MCTWKCLGMLCWCASHAPPCLIEIRESTCDSRPHRRRSVFLSLGHPPDQCRSDRGTLVGISDGDYVRDCTPWMLQQKPSSDNADRPLLCTSPFATSDLDQREGWRRWTGDARNHGEEGQVWKGERPFRRDPIDPQLSVNKTFAHGDTNRTV